MGCIVHGVAKSDMTEQPALSLWASLVAQLVKNLPALWETRVQSLGREDPLEKERPPTPVFWPGEIHGLYSAWDHKESDTTEWLSLHFTPYGRWGGFVFVFFNLFSASKFALKWSEVKLLSRFRLFATPLTVAYQASLSMGFSRQEYWSGLPLPSPFSSLNAQLNVRGYSQLLSWKILYNCSMK